MGKKGDRRLTRIHLHSDDTDEDYCGKAKHCVYGLPAEK